MTKNPATESTVAQENQEYQDLSFADQTVNILFLHVSVRNVSYHRAFTGGSGPSERDKNGQNREKRD